MNMRSIWSHVTGGDSVWSPLFRPQRSINSALSSLTISDRAMSERDLISLAPIEKLPRELAWKLIEYAPESVLVLRLSSRKLRGHVDKYAAQNRVRFPLVNELRVFSTNLFTAPPPLVPLNCILIEVPSSKSDLFQLRLKIRNFPISSLRRTSHAGSTAYWTTLSEAEKDKEASLRDCFGMKIGAIILNEYSFLLNGAKQLINAVQFEKLELSNQILCENEIKPLLAFIEDHNITHLSLNVRNTDLDDPVLTLFDLSSVVKSLHIHQHPLEVMQTPTNYLFGVYQGNWSSIILEMFSRKLDKLRIINHKYPNYLNTSAVDKLRESLPFIGKKVWFSATCPQPTSVIATSVNDHFVKVDYDGNVRIIHTSRQALP